MKIFLMLAILCTILAWGQDDSLNSGMTPKYYKKRAAPILNIALVYYGDYYSMDDLTRVQALLEQRFAISTDQALTLRTVVKAVLPFKNQLEDFPEYRQDYVTDPDRLQRLWYYDNVGAGVLEEVYLEARKSPLLKGELVNLDALIVITGAQFEALGFANGRIAVTENPMEIAWGLPEGGRVEFVTDARVVDELIHEIGHVIYLSHAGTQCSEPGLSVQESKACCLASPSRNDVMSYCRNRQLVNDVSFNKFEACNLRTIKNQIVPAILAGGEWRILNREVCL